MCTLKLKKVLKRAGHPRPDAKQEAAARVRLGNWAATVIRGQKTDLVVALNERTYLTLVFPLKPLRAFRRNFAEALAAALLDHGVAKALIPPECAQIKAAPIVRVRDETLKAAIDAASFIASIETCYHDELRDVQWNANQFPHGTVKPHVPTEGVRLLFGLRKDNCAPGARPRASRRPCVTVRTATRH